MKQGGGPVLVKCTISRRRTRNQMSATKCLGGDFRDLGLCLNQCSKVGVRKTKLQQRVKGEGGLPGRGAPVEGRAAQKPKGQASAWPVKGWGESRVDGTDQGCLKKGDELILANTMVPSMVPATYTGFQPF